MDIRVAARGNGGLSRIAGPVAVLLVTSLLLAVVADAGELPQSAVRHSDRDASDVAPASPTNRPQRREGDRYEGRGRFEITGDRITFYAEPEQETFRVVENLALERVARILADPAEAGLKRQWQIQAEVLEYRGANYLRLERVASKGRGP